MNFKHGGTDTKAFRAWIDMRRRCDNPNRPEFKDYGGRGIAYAPSWSEFRNFLADMGQPPPGASLDRINNELGYTKENCRWTDMKEQSRNRRSTKTLTLDGVTKTYIEWSEELGIKPNTISYRARHGWPVERILGVSNG